MRAVLFVSFSLALLFRAVPVVAEATKYECKMRGDDFESASWIPEVISLTMDEATDEGTVFDPIIEEFVGKPIKAKVRHQQDSAGNYRAIIQWHVRTVNANGQKARIEYTLRYETGPYSTWLNARPAGFDSVFTGSGTCDPVGG